MLPYRKAAFFLTISLIVSILFSACPGVTNPDSFVPNMIDSGLDYIESIEARNNPERGFYTPYYINLTTNGNSAIYPDAHLGHLRVGIGAFSAAYNGSIDLDFTADMLSALATTIENAKNNNCGLIIRFAYDNFEGTADMEPPAAQIINHIAQLSDILSNYSQTIIAIEAGCIGPWGEMHTSTMANATVFNQIIDAWLAAAPATIPISLRQPRFVADWLGIDIANIDQQNPAENTDEWRLGIYNDGYLGSSSDLGTYQNRTTEVAWLSQQATHTLFGGEVVAAAEAGYNTVAFMSQEMFDTHTSYLNSQWNTTVIDSWKNEDYEGDDPVYADQTGYTYLRNHLGYRYVLRESLLPESIPLQQIFPLNLQIENVGCANMIREKTVRLIFVQGATSFEKDMDIDVRQWASQETVNLHLNVDLPNGLDAGNCSVYMQIINPENNQAVQFANTEQWDADLQANALGSFTITNS